MNVTLTQRSIRSEDCEYSVDKTVFMIGRDPDCDLRVDHPMVSRRHCLIVLCADEVLVRDLESRNGIYVNNSERVTGARRLRDGDRLWIGPTAFDIHIGADFRSSDSPLRRGLQMHVTT